MTDYVFPSGSRNVVMVLAHQSSGVIAGTVTLGNPSSPRLPLIQFQIDARDPPPPPPPYDGLLYTVLDGTLDGTELSFGIEPREFWRPWCEFQDYIYETSSGFTCALHLPITERITDGTGTKLCESNGSGTLPCNQLALCILQKNFRSFVSGVCNCSNAGCSVCLPPKSAPVTFHLELQGDTLTGAVEAVDTPSMGFLAETFSGKRLTLTRL